MTSTDTSMRGRVCVVTGANAGIGYATALGLARLGATVVMVCRNRQRGEAALAAITRGSGNNNVSLLLADLSSQGSIRQLAQQIKDQHPVLHVLINNAGIIARKRTLTVDGHESQFAINHLACFLLTNLLLDLIKASAPARVINVSSQAHLRGVINLDDLQSTRSYRPNRVYAHSKLANVLFTYELARGLQGTGVTANCLHPGVVATHLLNNYMPRPLRFLARVMGTTADKGAQTSIYLASSPGVEGVTGKYFMNRKETRSSKASYDEDTAAGLWRVSAGLTGLPADP